uniref:Uncharacterized protein n=1 Tax=viral metagenome TaxID=1070528 RepID=A0A6M3M5H1_9ZZZZ
MEKTVFITVSGGMVQNVDVTKDLDDIDVVLIDYDVDGAPDEEVTGIDGNRAAVGKFRADTIGDGDHQLFKEWKKAAEE